MNNSICEISPTPTWAVVSGSRPIKIKNKYSKGKRITKIQDSEYEYEYTKEMHDCLVANSEKFDTMFNSNSVDVIEAVERLVKNLINDENTKITRSFKQYTLEHTEESNTGYYHVEIVLGYEETRIGFRVNLCGTLANSSKSDLEYNISLYDKFKDELDLLTIKNKKKDFFNCLEMFYQHNGLNRKDKIEKLLK